MAVCKQWQVERKRNECDWTSNETSMANWDTIVCWVHQLINEIDLFCQVNNEWSALNDVCCREQSPTQGKVRVSFFIFSFRYRRRCCCCYPLNHAAFVVHHTIYSHLVMRKWTVLYSWMEMLVVRYESFSHTSKNRKRTLESNCHSLANNHSAHWHDRWLFLVFRTWMSITS